jgi:hypothetical protein
MIDHNTVEALRKQFPVHPLVFQRSVEHAESAGELFDILDTVPECPFVWGEEERRWVQVPDVSMSSSLLKINKKKRKKK